MMRSDGRQRYIIGYTHISFHVALPSACLLRYSVQSTSHEDAKHVYFAVSFPSFGMITPPSTPFIAVDPPGVTSKSCAGPTSSKRLPVKGSKYVRVGSWNMSKVDITSYRTQNHQNSSINPTWHFIPELLRRREKFS